MQAQTKKLSAASLPSQREAELAQESSRTLDAYVRTAKDPTFQLVDSQGTITQISFPLSAIKLLTEILIQMAEGNAVTLLPVHAELTTQESADLLNVSRPYLVKLLDSNEIPHRKIGTRRRVLAEDILKYKENIDKQRLKTLEKLSKQAQDLDMGYE